MYLSGEVTLQEPKCSFAIVVLGYKNRSAVCGGFLSLSGYKPLLGGNGKMCSSKRNITFIISCQFQTGLRILKTLFDFYVFFKSWLKKNSHCMCCVFRCLWRHNLKIDFQYFFLEWIDLAWHRESPSRIQISSASSSGKSKKGTKEILNGFLFHLVSFNIFHICCFFLTNITHQINVCFKDTLFTLLWFRFF